MKQITFHASESEAYNYFVAFCRLKGFGFSSQMTNADTICVRFDFGIDVTPIVPVEVASAVKVEPEPDPAIANEPNKTIL